MAVVCLQALGNLRHAAANFNFGGTRDDFGAVCTFEASAAMRIRGYQQDGRLRMGLGGKRLPPGRKHVWIILD